MKKAKPENSPLGNYNRKDCRVVSRRLFGRIGFFQSSKLINFLGQLDPLYRINCLSSNCGSSHLYGSDQGCSETRKCLKKRSLNVRIQLNRTKLKVKMKIKKEMHRKALDGTV